MNYNTTTKRRVASSDRLYMINQYYSDEENLAERAATSLGAIQTEGFPDLQYRDICYDCCCQIYYAYREGSELGNFTINTGNKGYRWIAPTSINLLNYAPAEEVKDPSGKKYSKYINDVNGCWSLFKRYYNRGGELTNQLSDWKDVFDDGYVRQRFLRDLEKKYEDVVKDVKYSKGGLFSSPGVSVSKWQTVVKDVKIVEWESNPEPSLPTTTDFRGLVSKSSDDNSITGLINTLTNINLTAQREPWMDLFEVPNIKTNNLIFHIHDTNYTKEYAEEIRSKVLNQKLFFQSANELSWAITKTYTADVEIVDKVIKPEYADKYNNATPQIKSEIYESYPEYYFDCRYELFVVIGVWDNKYETGLTTIPMRLMEAPTGNVYTSIIQEITTNIYDKLRNAYSIYKEAPSSTRCEDGNPEEFYSEVIKRIRDANYDTVTNCSQVINYCRQILPWIKQRTNALLAQTTDDSNAEKFITALSKRLNKNTGSLFLWYGNVISIDQEVENLEKEKKLTTKFLKGMAVAKCFSNTDETLSCNASCPNYIDVSPLDSFYNTYKYSFNKNDTVYIVDDTHTEFIAKITKVENKSIKTISNEEINITSDNKVETSYNYTKILRLHLNKKLPTYYSSGNDVSSLRVLKIC